MTITQTLRILRDHNRYRRTGQESGYTPEEIGNAIDSARVLILRLIDAEKIVDDFANTPPYPVVGLDPVRERAVHYMEYQADVIIPVIPEDTELEHAKTLVCQLRNIVERGPDMYSASEYAQIMAEARKIAEEEEP